MNTKFCFHQSFVFTILFEIEIFCNIINAFTLTFEQFNVSFLNKSNTLQ